MHADAFARARKLLSDRQGLITTLNVLGTVQALLVLGLLLVIGMLTALLTTHGETRIRVEQKEALFSRAAWVRPLFVQENHPAEAEAGSSQDEYLFQKTGLLPVAAGSLNSPNPAHRWFGAILFAWLERFPTLRNNVGALASLLALGLLQLLLLCIVSSYRRRTIAEVATHLATQLRSQIHRQMYRLGQSSLPTEGTGPVVNLLTREVNDVRDGLATMLDRCWRAPVLGAGLVLTSLVLAPVLSLAVAAIGGLVWTVARVIRNDSRLASDAALRDAAVQLSLLHEDMGMLRTVRVYGMENIDKDRFDEHLQRFREADARRLKSEGTMNPTLWLLYGAAAALAVGLLGFSVLQGRTSPAAFLVMPLAIAMITQPVLEWIGMSRAIRQATRSAGGIFEFLDRRPELQQQGGALFLAPLKDKIQFENVSLESRSGRLLLDGVTAEIPAGSKTAIMSLDEDSKHALVCLIPRLIDPKVGRVRIDGQDLREVTLESVRAQVATVLQADLVFTDSVTMNIGLGDPSYTMPRIIEAAKVAHAHNFIQDLPHGYDTVIGPVGHYLKPDEQYRIALARAYLHDPAVLIVEEPLVPLDDEVKPLIDDTIARISRNRTLIILPHRLSTIRSCQQIIVLHNGRVEAIGQPRALSDSNKLFRHLQYVEFNQFATGEMEAGQMGG
ncbi:MAG: ABC transporter ATP-binding protein [Isosphaeraceae bacterium]